MASDEGKGFIVPENDVIAHTKNGKQVLNVKGGFKAQSCAVVEGDHVAVIGKNRKLLIFPTSELPEMKRGKGVRMQKYKDAGLSDAKTFNMADGLSWSLGDRIRVETKLTPWLGKRASAGRLPPTGFPKNNRFS